MRVERDGPNALGRKDAVGCRAGVCRRAIFATNCGPATSAGPTHHSVIAGIFRKARSDCIATVKSVLRTSRSTVFGHRIVYAFAGFPLVQASFKVMVRLKTGWPGRLSGSRAK